MNVMMKHYTDRTDRNRLAYSTDRGGHRPATIRDLLAGTRWNPTVRHTPGAPPLSDSKGLRGREPGGPLTTLLPDDPDTEQGDR